MEESKPPVEQFPALVRLEGLRHCFTQRVPGIEVAQDKMEALRRLDHVHGEVRAACGFGDMPFVTAEQVHGNAIDVVTEKRSSCRPNCDGLITNQRGVCLGVYVADCCAVYLVDTARHAIGLVHSGRKGSELDIVGKAIEAMRVNFGTAPSDLIVQLSPCIRPPHYEIDFAAEIVRSSQAHGVKQVHDGGVCTACHLERYYSYRAEKGKTGRMLALLALA